MLKLDINHLDKNKKVGLALSGGVDSMVLYDILVKEGFDVIPVHFNHNLREESKIEQEYLLKNIPNLAYKVWENPSSSENDCRLARYDFFKNVCLENNIEVFFVGHHGNDRAENFFIKLIKGTGIKGLTTFSKKSTETLLGKDITVLRPLMDYKKEDIYSYADNNGVVYFEDKTNAENDYLRNRVRNNYIPEMEKENKNFVNNVNNLMDDLEELNSLLEYQLKEFYTKKSCLVGGLNALITGEEFYKMPKVLRREIIKKYISRVFNVEGNKNQVTRNLLEDIDYFLSNSDRGKHYVLSKDYSIYKDFNGEDDVMVLVPNSYFNLENFEVKATKKEKYNGKRLTDYYRENKVPYIIRKRSAVEKDSKGNIIKVIL